MSATFDRADQLVDELTDAGVRATIEPATAAPPCVLVLPPTRRYDLACGFTARWTLAAIAPGALGADRTTWDALDVLADAVAATVDVFDAEPVAYVLNGQQLPALLLTFEEAV